MAHRRIWTVSALIAATLGVALSAVFGGVLTTAAATGATPAATNTEPASGASAAQLFGCRASVARVSLGGNVLAEPAVANNPQTPCATDQKLVGSTQLVGPGSMNLGSVGPAEALTYETGALGSSTEPSAESLVSVQGISLNLGGYTLTAAGPLYSEAAIECTATGAQGQFAPPSSGLTALTITGPGIPNGSETLSLNGVVGALQNLPAALAPLLKISANTTTNTGTTLTQTLLEVQLLGVLNGGADIVVGESKVSENDLGVCTNNGPVITTVTGTTTTLTGTDGTATTVSTPGTTTTVTAPGGSTTTGGGTITVTGGSVPTYLSACAPGSQLNPTSGNCDIFLPGGGTIYVSAPFKGPTGGTVVPVSVAKTRLTSRCLTGSGPAWVLIVSQKGIHAKGTPNADRIIGIAPDVWVNGLAGNDCVDLQGGGSEHLDEANGNDRDYVLKGTARIVVGNGADTVDAEHTTGWITGGNGTDHITAGTGKYRIDLGRGPGAKYVKTTKAYARIYTPGGKGQISCVNKTDTLWVLRAVAKYADAHGCQTKLTHLLN